MERLAGWMRSAGIGVVGPVEVVRLHGGNSNLTFLVVDGDGQRFVVRRPPDHGIDPSAHSMEREWRVLSALGSVGAPVPVARAYCADPAILGAPFLVMDEVPDSVSLTETLPYSGPQDAVLEAIGTELMTALAAVHSVDWRGAGLEGFGRPEGFLARQVPRWERQYRGYQVRDLPDFDAVAAWLSDHLPPEGEPAVMHGDFHLDNCLFSAVEPRALAIVDWEMSTIGDPLLDVGLALAFWGTRSPRPPAMPRVQGVSRLPGSPPRQALADTYAGLTGRSVEHLDWYCAFALWKLAAIVEGAWAQYVDGRLDSAYGAALDYDVPALLSEAAAFAGLESHPPEREDTVT